MGLYGDNGWVSFKTWRAGGKQPQTSPTPYSWAPRLHRCKLPPDRALAKTSFRTHTSWEPSDEANTSISVVTVPLAIVASVHTHTNIQTHTKSNPHPQYHIFASNNIKAKGQNAAKHGHSYTQVTSTKIWAQSTALVIFKQNKINLSDAFSKNTKSKFGLEQKSLGQDAAGLIT